MKIYSLIPARSGSKRVKDKNIRMLGGFPLIWHSIIISMNTPEIERTFVSTDSKDYGQIALESGAEVIMRGPELSSDDCGDREVIKHFLEQYPCDIVIYLRPTTPFRNVGMVSEAIKTLIEAGDNRTGLRSYEEMKESAFKCVTIEPGLFVEPIRYLGQDMTDKPNQKVKETYHPNGYVDIAKASEINKGNIWGDRRVALITPRVIEIDEEEDLEFAEWWLAHRSRKEVVFKMPWH